MNKHLIVLALIALLCISQVEGFRHSRRRSSNNGNSSDSGSTTKNNDNTESTTSDNSNTENGENSTDTSTDTSTSSGSDVESVLLALHNNLRSSLGIAPLTWSSSLASASQAWSDTMASTGNFKHGGTNGSGENIAYGTARVYDASDLFGFWSSESKWFITGPNYPDVSTTGNALDVAHYTQILWSKTTEVGCGLSESSSGLNYLTCQYYPPGNILGEAVY